MVEKIRKLCKNCNLSLTKLELALGFGNGAIGRWDKSTPSIDKVIKVAQYFDVSLDYLCGLTDKKTPADELDGLTDEDLEIIRLFEKAKPERKEAALLLLKSP